MPLAKCSSGSKENRQFCKAIAIIQLSTQESFTIAHQPSWELSFLTFARSAKKKLQGSDPRVHYKTIILIIFLPCSTKRIVHQRPEASIKKTEAIPRNRPNSMETINPRSLSRKSCANSSLLRKGKKKTLPEQRRPTWRLLTDGWPYKSDDGELSQWSDVLQPTSSSTTGSLVNAGKLVLSRRLAEPDPVTTIIAIQKSNCLPEAIEKSGQRHFYKTTATYCWINDTEYYALLWNNISGLATDISSLNEPNIDI